MPRITDANARPTENFSEVTEKPICPLLTKHYIYPLINDRDPTLMVKLMDRNSPMILDTGAHVSVLPKSLLAELINLPPQGHANRHVKVFGGKEVMLDGPVNIKIKICGLEVVHPFYYVDADIPAIGGYDLMRVAHIIIDTNRSEVWSKHPDVAEPVQMSQDVAEMMKPFSSVPGSSPADCDQHVPDPDAMAPCPQAQPRYVTVADNPECRPQLRPRAHSLSVTDDTSQRPLPHTGEMTSTQNEFCDVPNAKPQFRT